MKNRGRREGKRGKGIGKGREEREKICRTNVKLLPTPLSS